MRTSLQKLDHHTIFLQKVVENVVFLSKTSILHRFSLLFRSLDTSGRAGLRSGHIFGNGLNTAHVLRLNKADVLALNKAHVLHLNTKICPVLTANTKETTKGGRAEGARPPLWRRPKAASFVGVGFCVFWAVGIHICIVGASLDTIALPAE